MSPYKSSRPGGRGRKPASASGGKFTRRRDGDSPSNSPSGYRERSSGLRGKSRTDKPHFSRSGDEAGEKRSRPRKDAPSFRSGDRPDRPAFRKREDGKGDFRREEGGERRPSFRKPFRSEGSGSGDRTEKRFTRGEGRTGGPRPRNSFKEGSDREERSPARGASSRFSGSDRSGSDRPRREFRKEGSEREERAPRREREGEEKPARRTPGKARFGSDRSDDTRKWNRKESHEFYGDRKKKPGIFGKRERKPATTAADEGLTRLNKYIANAGVCSRREADELITAGVVSVNGEIVTEMGYKVRPEDVVRYNDAVLRGERLSYVLLNKPKDFITTTDDPEERKTVMNLIAGAGKERIYPVGRLDRNTTGVLLFTNDGDLARKLTHPSFEVQKVYQVELDEPLKGEDMEAIEKGIRLDDGFIKVDDIAWVDAKDRSILGVELHSGKNRIVRRIFEHFGYKVKKLDRVVFAGLTKKDLPRGRWRFLTELEVANLKMITGNKKVKVTED